jgi:uncharacterized protein (TIGR00730 family)
LNTIHALSVFCGSSISNVEAFRKEANLLGKYFGQHQIKLIYGGAKVGLMGAVSDAVLAQGGHVIGVIPDFIKTKEVAHDGLTQLIEVKTMHERKMKMFEISDGAIVLPGGFGTMDEMFELLTWGQLGLHKKPIGILNVEGFYDHLIKFLDHMVSTGLLRMSNRDMVIVSNDIEDLINSMKKYEAPLKAKWLEPDQV